MLNCYFCLELEREPEGEDPEDDPLRLSADKDLESERLVFLRPLEDDDLERLRFLPLSEEVDDCELERDLFRGDEDPRRDLELDFDRGDLD